MSDSTKPAFIDGGKAVGSAVLLGTAVIGVSYQSRPSEALLLALLLLPLLPVPIAYLTARHGMMVGISAALVIGTLCTAVTVATGTSLGLLVFLVSTIAGIYAGMSFRAGTNLYRILVMMTLLMMGIMLLWSGIFLLREGLSPAAALQDVTDDVARNSSGLYTALGIEESSIDEMRAQAGERIPYLIPSIMMVVAGLMSIATVAVSRFTFKLLKQPFPADIRFSEFRLHYAFVYAFIIGMVLIFTSSYLSADAGRYADAVGENLVIVTQSLFFIQGLAIAVWFLKRKKASGIVKTAVYIGTGLLEALLSLTSLVGIFDVFIDFRKRYGNKRIEKHNNR